MLEEQRCIADGHRTVPVDIPDLLRERWQAPQQQQKEQRAMERLLAQP